MELNARGGDRSLSAQFPWSKKVSESLDRTGVDQQPVEAPRLGSAGACIEQPVATLKNPFLLDERRIKRQSSRILRDQWQVGPLDRVERGGDIDRFEVDCIDGVV